MMNIAEMLQRFMFHGHSRLSMYHACVTHVYGVCAPVDGVEPVWIRFRHVWRSVSYVTSYVSYVPYAHESEFGLMLHMCGYQARPTKC